jgi:hypothetical protein
MRRVVYPDLSTIPDDPPPPAPRLSKVAYPVVRELAYYEEQYYASMYHATPDSHFGRSGLHFDPWCLQSWRPGRPPPAHLYPTIKLLEPPAQNFSLAEFQELRHHATEDSARGQLASLGTDITRRSPSASTRRSLSRVCLIASNTYAGTSKSLGVGPINDAIVTAANHAVMGYDIYFLITPTSKHFLECLQFFLAQTTDFLTVYYSGHGCERPTTDLSETSGYHELMYFEDAVIQDNVLADYLKQYSKGCAKTLLLNDCCHSGTLWNIPKRPERAMTFPANIVSFSASDDRETAKQGSIGEGSQGLFTYYFWKHLKERPGIMLADLQPIINQSLVRFKQHTVLMATRTPLLKAPFFPTQ